MFIRHRNIVNKFTDVLCTSLFVVDVLFRYEYASRQFITILIQPTNVAAAVHRGAVEQDLLLLLSRNSTKHVKYILLVVKINNCEFTTFPVRTEDDNNNIIYLNAIVQYK